MRRTKWTRLCAGVLAVLSGTAAGAAAEPMISGKEIFPEIYLQRKAAVQEGLLALDDSATARGLYSKLFNWPPGYTRLRVCFLAGSDAVNSAVAQVANGWNTETNLSIKFDFGKLDKPRRCKPGGKTSQVRVSYDKPGFWSLAGQDSIKYAEQDEASLNLEMFDQVKDLRQLTDGEFKGTILHEFGHALGLLHEHQSPVAACVNEFNWKFIFDYLKGPPNNWTEGQIKFNMAPYSDTDDNLMMTEFDPESIMLYSFPAEYYLKGEQSECYIGRSNNAISSQDKFTVEYMYPVDAAARMKTFEQLRAEFASIVETAKAKGTKSAGMDFDKLFFSAPPEEAGDAED